MVERLPVDIVEGGQRVMESVDFQDERIPLSPHSFPCVERIEIPGEGIADTGDQFFGAVRQGQAVQVCGKEAVGQEPGVHFKDSYRQIVEAACQVGIASEKEFVFRGRQRDVIELLHRIPISSLHNPFAHFLPPRFIRHSRNAENEDTTNNRSLFSAPFPRAVPLSATQMRAPLCLRRPQVSARNGRFLLSTQTR